MKIKRLIASILTAIILLGCIPLSANATEVDMENLFSVYMKYHDFLKQTAEKCDVNTWRFTFDHIDSDEYPELLIALSENIKDTQVQFYTCKPDGKVTFQYQKGKYATVTYSIGKNKIYDGNKYNGETDCKVFNANSNLDGYSYSEENFYTALTKTSKAIGQPCMDFQEVEEFQWYEYSQKNDLSGKSGLIEDFLNQHKASSPKDKYALQLLNNGKDLYIIISVSALLPKLSYYYCDLKNNKVTHIGEIDGANLTLELYGNEMLYSSYVSVGNQGNRSVIMTGYQIKNHKIEEKLKMTANHFTTPVSFNDENGRSLSMAEMEYIDNESYFINETEVGISDFYSKLADCFDSAKQMIKPVVFQSSDDNTIGDIISNSGKSEYLTDDSIPSKLFVKWNILLMQKYNTMERYEAISAYNHLIKSYKSNDKEEFYYIITQIDYDETPEIVILRKDKKINKYTWAQVYTFEDTMFCNWSVYPYSMTEEEIYKFVEGKELTLITSSQ